MSIIVNKFKSAYVLINMQQVQSWLVMARKKRSTHKESGREDRPSAERRSGKRDAEGSFGAGFLNSQ